MLEWTDTETAFSIRLLSNLARENKKPIVFWVGAGASAWCGYPLWRDLGDLFHSQFCRYVSGYGRKKGLELLNAELFPQLFELCRTTDRQQFYKFLNESLTVRPTTPLYQRLIICLGSVFPLQVVTTNIDECLEHHLPATNTIQRTNLERITECLASARSFIGKLHGTASSIESSIFTAGDYNALVADEKYTALLTHLFSHCSVVFVGYGLSEDYVLQLMVGSSELHQVFGDGPHFAILGSKRDHLPGSVKPILYLNEPHHDHRAAIRILEEIKHAREVSDVGLARRLLEPCHGSATALKSCHLISDFLPPGTWNVSHTLTLDRADGSKARVTVGHGFNAAEVPFTISTAIHDLAVGLLCFDLVYIPINAIGKLHEVLGFQMFWQLIKSESIRFIHWQSEEGVFVAGDDATIVGELKQIAVLGEHRLPRSTGEVIRRFLHPVDGKDTEAEALFQKLESNAVFISDAEIPDVGNLVKGLLLLPTIRRLLGFSDGILLDSLPQLADFSCPPASSACPARRHLSILGHFIGQAPFWR